MITAGKKIQKDQEVRGVGGGPYVPMAGSPGVFVSWDLLFFSFLTLMTIGVSLCCRIVPRLILSIAFTRSVSEPDLKPGREQGICWIASLVTSVGALADWPCFLMGLCKFYSSHHSHRSVVHSDVTIARRGMSVNGLCSLHGSLGTFSSRRLFHMGRALSSVSLSLCPSQASGLLRSGLSSVCPADLPEP